MSVPRRMLAWRGGLGGARALALEEARVPPLRAPDHLLVQVSYASLNPIDYQMLDGYGSHVLSLLRCVEGWLGELLPDPPPIVVGRDLCGRVVRAGPHARARVGDRVWAVLPPHWPGALSQYVLVRDSWAGPAPSRLSDAQAGGALYAGLTACALLRAAGAGAGAGARALVLGAGGVGQAALQLLRARGAAAVAGCAGDAARAALDCGADTVLDRHAPDYEEQLEKNGPYDAILDCAGLGGSEAARRRWRFSRYVTLSSPLLRETDARGALGWAWSALELARQCAAAAASARDAPGPGPNSLLPPHVRWAYFMPLKDDIDYLYKLAERGEFSVVVESVRGWRGAGAALARGLSGARGKLLIDFTNDTVCDDDLPPPPRQDTPLTAK